MIECILRKFSRFSKNEERGFGGCEHDLDDWKIETKKPEGLVFGQRPESGVRRSFIQERQRGRAGTGRDGAGEGGYRRVQAGQ